MLPSSESERSGVSEMLCLTGRPSLKHFLRFVSEKALHCEPESDLVEEWHAAQSLIENLQTEEAGQADHPYLEELGEDFEPLLIEFLKDPIQRANFNTVPTGISLVELGSLTVFQPHIDLTFANELALKIGPSPERDVIFKTCLPYDHPRPPVKWARIDSNTFVFASPSNDLRFLGAAALDSGPLQACAPSGDVVNCVGLGIGFGSNLMNAFYVENRLILHNGSHRAYALRKLGVTHAPCIVQHVPSREALAVVAPSEITSKPDLYLKHPRPPLLKDYFNPQLHKVFEFRRRLQQITVKFEVSESESLA